jgi:PAS domain S-box-containing protein
VTTPRAELRRLRSLVADLNGVVWEADARSGRFTFVSQRAADLLGYAPEQWTSDPSFWADHIHPDDRERAVEGLMASAADGRPHDTEYRFMHRDGSIVWIRDIGHAVIDRSGEVAAVRGLLVDVTPQKAEEERQVEVERRYRNLVEQLPAVVYLEALELEDGFGRLIYVSPQLERTLGYRAEGWLVDPRERARRTHPDDLPAVRQARMAAAATGGPFRADYRMFANGDSLVWIHDEAVLVRDEQGQGMFRQGVMLDVTERMRAARLEDELDAEREETAQLRELDSVKNTFLQAVSHDLRTPLAAILGLAVTLEREDVQLSPDDARNMATRIAANARRLDRMVNDLLDLDRLSRGIVKPSLAPTDVGALVSRLVADTDIVADRRVLVEAEPVTAEIDAAKVERMVENLLANAVRHTPPDTRIWVRVTTSDGGVLIAVEDEGPGIPAEHRELIFEPFRRGPEAPEHGPGVGVGLALVARFAELHGGRAWVEERRGGGASFRIWLPLRDPSASAPSTSSVADPTEG